MLIARFLVEIIHLANFTRVDKNFVKKISLKKFNAFLATGKLRRFGEFEVISGHKFGKCSCKNVGEIKGKFFAKCCAPATFCLAKKV
jgi:hypothetical protein